MMGCSRIALGGVLGVGDSTSRVGVGGFGDDGGGFATTVCARNGEGPRLSGFSVIRLSPKLVLDFLDPVLVKPKSVFALSGLTLGLLPLLENTSLNLLAGDFPRTWLVPVGLSVSALSVNPGSGRSVGIFCKADVLGEFGTLEFAEGGSMS